MKVLRYLIETKGRKERKYTRTGGIKRNQTVRWQIETQIGFIKDKQTK